MAVAFDQKSTSPIGKDSGVKKTPPPRRPTAEQATMLAAEEQGANVFKEANYMRLSEAQEEIIRIGVEKLHEAIEPWGELRSQGEGPLMMEHSEYERTLRGIHNNLRAAYRELDTNFTQSATTFTQEIEGSNTYQIPLRDHKMARVEVARQLNRDTFPIYYKELLTMHGLFGALELKALMKEFLGVEVTKETHVYKLRTLIGVEAGVDVGVSGGGAFKAFRISYENDLGVKWSRTVVGAYAKGGVGVGVPIEANVESSWGSDQFSAGTATSSTYYPPSYFDIVSASGASAGGGQGLQKSVGVLYLGDLAFDIGGKSVKFGTALVPGASSEVTPLGMFVGGPVSDVRGLDYAKDVPEKKRGGGWIRVIEAKVYFRTEELALDRDDHRSLDSVVGSIVNHDRYYPGDACKILSKGYASEAWATPNSSAQDYHLDTSRIDAQQIGRDEKSQKKRNLLNEKLAASRTFVVNMALKNKLASKRISAKISYDSLGPEIIRSGLPAADRNEPTDRYVEVGVEYPKNGQSMRTK